MRKELSILGCAKLSRLTIVYHRPGSQAGYLLLKVFVGALEARLGCPVELVEISSVEPIDSEKILVLLPCRGGHWHHLLNRVKLGEIVRLPPVVVAAIFARSARARAVERLVLCYLKAKRFYEEQEEDIKTIIAALERFGIEVEVLALDRLTPSKRRLEIMGVRDRAVAPLAIFPGKLVETCHLASQGIPLGPLLVEGFDILLEWACRAVKGQSDYHVLVV